MKTDFLIKNKHKTIMDLFVEKELLRQFNKKYLDRNEVYIPYNENGIGILDIKLYPYTDLHRNLYPELYEFTFYHFQGHITRNDQNIWCGYANSETPFHPYWTKDKDLGEIPHVHGEITYGNLKETTMGFDCNHYFDANPFSSLRSDREYRDHSYVKNEVRSLCRQLYLMLPKWNSETNKQFPKSLRKRYFDLYKIWYLRKQSKNLSKIFEKDIWVIIINKTVNIETI